MITVRRNVLVGGSSAPSIPGPVRMVRVAFRGVPIGAGAVAPVVAIIPTRRQDQESRDGDPILVSPGESAAFGFGYSVEGVRLEAPAGGQAFVDVWYGTEEGDELRVSNQAGSVLLYDLTGLPNTTHDTGSIDTHAISAVYVEAIALGGAMPAGGISFNEVDDAGVVIQTWVGTLLTIAAGYACGFAWGAGWSNSTGATQVIQAIPAPLPGRSRVMLGVLGPGVSGRVRVWGRP